MSEITVKGSQAKESAKVLALLSTAEKNNALMKIAELLETKAEEILSENAVDLQKGKEKNISPSLLDRLSLSKERIKAMADGVREVVDLPDPIGVIKDTFHRPNGLVIEKIQVPLGVIGMIYEARPNVTVDASVLAFKTGNAIILRGSSSALNSNKAIVKVIHEALEEVGVPQNAVQLLEDTNHDSVTEFIRCNEYIDVLIPRGGKNLIENVLNNATVPVLKTGVGNCHVYIDKDAKPDMAKEIVINSKTHRPSVCNAAETLLLHKDYPYGEEIINALLEQGVILHVCEDTLKRYPDLKEKEGVQPATEEDWPTEYLDMEMAVKTVDSLEEALLHIDTYGTNHTECIVTENTDTAETFLKRVDAAAVNHNASTRFTDGFEYGFGAEIGISTQKTHARGPMGLPELTSYKFLVHGTGQIRK